MKENRVLVTFIRRKTDLNRAKNDMWTLKLHKIQTRLILTAQKVCKQPHRFDLMCTLRPQNKCIFAHIAVINDNVRG